MSTEEVESTNNLDEFVFVEYAKHLNGYDKCLQTPLKVISCGFRVYSDNDKVAISQAFYPTAKKHFSDVKVIPNYKMLSSLPDTISKDLRTFIFRDAMWITKSSTRERLRKWKPSLIKSTGFLIAEKSDAYIISFMYVPDRGKYSELSVIPKFNVLEINHV